MIKTIKMELEKVLKGNGFCLCIFCAFALCLTAGVYTDSLTDRRYSAIEAVMTFSRSELREDWQFCSREVIRKGAQGWFSFFLPIVAAFPSIPLLCDEYKTKYIRYEIFRSKKKSFYAAKLAAAFLGGAMAVAAGYALFSLAACLMFPKPLELSPMALQGYQLMAGDNGRTFSGTFLFGDALRILCCAFLAGGINALPVVILSGISQNKYVVMCIPFFLKYGVLQGCLSMNDLFVRGGVPRWLTEVNTVINPDTPLYLYQFQGDIRWKSMIWYLIMVVFYSGCYLIIQERRLDCGE